MKLILKHCLRTLCLVLSSVVALSCGPGKYTMHLEMKQPSKAGVDLSGKTVSMVYLENGNQMHDEFVSYLASGFAESLQNDYGTGEGSVGVFRMSREYGADYASKDTLVNLLMDTGSDVVFLLDTVKLGVMSVGTKNKVSYTAGVSSDSTYINTASIPYTIKMYCFDAMNSKEEVKTFTGTSVAQPSVYSDGNKTNEELIKDAYAALGKEGWTVGEFLASSFEPQWKVEGFPIIYYDSEKWIDALEYADQFKWKKAMDVWLELVSSKDIMKRSCAAYNISLACYIMGDYRLAKEWLDLSDTETELPVSKSLRTKINSRLK